MHSLTIALYLATLIFAPLAFGSVETWSIGLVETLVFLTGLSFLFQLRANRQALFTVPGILPLLLFLLLIFLQLLPLPPSLVRLVAPGVHETYAPILAVHESWIPLTVNHKATLLEFLRISSYVVFYIITVQLLSRPRLLTKTVKIIAGLAAVIAFLAILQKITSPKDIYWFRHAPGNSSMGPWIYTNHYAGFMEMVFPLVLALFFFYHPDINRSRSLRERIVSLFSSAESNSYLFWGFSIVIILISMFISLSRGGIIAMILGLFFFLLLLRTKGNVTQKTLPLLLLAAVLLTLSWFGWDTILAKFIPPADKTGFLTNDRLHIWQNCLPLIRDFLFTGSGLATFPFIFQKYSTMTTTTEYIEHAHNDYIELLTDGGLIGFLLIAWFVITIFRHGFQRLGVRKGRYPILLIIAGLAAIFSLLVHSATDFNMHNGANGLYFFFLCGIVVSAGNTRMQYRKNPTLLKPVSPKWRLGLLVALPLLLLTITVQGGILRAGKIYNEVSKIYLNPQISERTLQTQLTKISQAIQADPLEGLYSYHQGHLFFYLHQKQASLNSYLQAAEKDPMSGDYLQRLALSLPPGDSTRASRLMKESYARSITKKHLILPWAEWHLRNNRRKDAAEVLQQGISRFPRLAGNLAAFFLNNEFDREEIRSILPQRLSTWAAFGKYFEKRNMPEDAEFYYRHALGHVDKEKSVLPRYFTQVYNFYRRQKQYDEAAAVLRKGIEHLPNHAPFHTSLGDNYKQQNLLQEARDEYEQALLLNPNNMTIKKRLRSLQNKK